MLSKKSKELLDYVVKISNDIAKLKIRGATKIALTALKVLSKVASEAPLNEFDQIFKKSIEILINSRPTEPAMQNGIRYILHIYEKTYSKDGIREEIRHTIKDATLNFYDIMKKAIDKIVEIGWRRIPNGGVIMTHCHSATVVRILKRAKEKDKKFVVITSETRPLYQGRRTAKELAESGIRVYHIVDSAMRWAAKKFKPDIAIIGADAIGSNGVVINKIGSKLLALVAREFDFPLYVASTLLKLDVRTVLGEYTPIELRDPSEVWPDAPPGVEVLNPSFETIAPDYIDGIITETGIIAPSDVLRAFKELYEEIYAVTIPQH